MNKTNLLYLKDFDLPICWRYGNTIIVHDSNFSLNIVDEILNTTGTYFNTVTTLFTRFNIKSFSNRIKLKHYLYNFER